MLRRATVVVDLRVRRGCDICLAYEMQMAIAAPGAK
jgi:hypothetical protein